MMLFNKTQVHNRHSDDDTNDPTAPFYEVDRFYFVWEAFTWEQIRNRVPICFRKTIHNRYMLANLIYLCYIIGNLIIDFNSNFYGSFVNADNTEITVTTMATSVSVLDESVINIPRANRLYIGFAAVQLASAFLYWWAWRDRSWLDVIMIPEYLNHIQAGLYLWTAIWYSREDTLGDYYTLTIHKIEMVAATVELVASCGWIMSWYMTYTRTLGRGYSLDDPDTIAYLSTLIGSILYFIYNIQINVHPEQYNTNFLYTYGDILYSVGACYYIIAALRDDHWFWFLPLAGQYGVAPGRIEIETKKVLPSCGKPSMLMTDACRRRQTADDIMKEKRNKLNSNNTTIKTFRV